MMKRYKISFSTDFSVRQEGLVWLTFITSDWAKHSVCFKISL